MRPQLVKKLREHLNLSSNLLSRMKNVSSDLQIFTDVEISSLEKLIYSTEEWLNTTEGALSLNPLHQAPVLLSADLEERIRSLEREVMYLLNKLKMHKRKSVVPPISSPTTNNNNTNSNKTSNSSTSTGSNSSSNTSQVNDDTTDGQTDPTGDKEMPNLITDSLSRPADVFLPTWSSAALDVHVISPLQQQTLGEAAPLQVMLCKLVFSGSWPPTSQPAEWSLSHSW